MSDHRAEIVKRVMRSLEDTTDPDQLVNAYFDAEHDIVVQATRETLEATNDFLSEAVIAERVESELVEILRFPRGGAGGGLLPTLYAHRRAVAVTGTLVAATSAPMALFWLF